VRIEDWYCTVSYHISDFCLPDTKKIKIGGCVYDHPYVKDGSYIRTPEIIQWTEDKIVTIGDDKWTLGKMDELYKIFLENEGYEGKIDKRIKM